MSDISDYIIKILADKGVLVKQTDIWKDNGLVRNVKSIIELDFSEHDKVFEDKIAKLEKENKDLNSYIVQREQDSTDMIMELKKRIAELESKEMPDLPDLPFDPLECANYLINATYERETNSLERGLKGLPEKVNSDKYTIDELEQIAEHLLVYCKHNKERDNEKEI